MSNHNEHLISIKVVRVSDKDFICIELPCKDLEEQIEEFVGNERYYVAFNKAEISHLPLPEINRLAESLDQFDAALVNAIYEYTGSLVDTYNCLIDGRYQYSFDICDLTEVAIEMVELGLLGTVPDEALKYIDYKAIARDLKNQGWRVINKIALLTY